MHSELHHNVAQGPLQEGAWPMRAQAEKTSPPPRSQQANNGHHLHTEADVLTEHSSVAARSSHTTGAMGAFDSGETPSSAVC